MSIMLKNRTVDFTAMGQEVLIDVWVGLSSMIYESQKIKTCIPLTRHQFAVFSVQAKIRQECANR
jgi:hypothetical protein